MAAVSTMHQGGPAPADSNSNREHPSVHTHHRTDSAGHEDHCHDLEHSSSFLSWLGACFTKGRSTQHNCCQQGNILRAHHHLDHDESFAEQYIDQEKATFDADVERGSPTYQAMRFSVQGMTCSTCEMSLRRALCRVPGVRKAQIDSVRAELRFDLDQSILTADEAIRKLKAMTTFEFTEIQQTDRVYLDVSVDDWQIFSEIPRPDGVIGVERLPKLESARSCYDCIPCITCCVGHQPEPDKDTVRIRYDPAKIFPQHILQCFGLQESELAPMCPDTAALNGKKHLRKELVYTILAVILTIPILVFAWAPLPEPQWPYAYEVPSLVLGTLIQIGIGWEFYPSALKTLFRNRLIEMDLLIVLSTSMAYLFSVITFAFSLKAIDLSSGLYFETSALLITLIRLGRFFCELARRRATDSVSVDSLQSTKALLTNPETHTFIRKIDVRLLQPGDCFRIDKGSRIPTDGTVLEGAGRVDESTMTGESYPVVKSKHSLVIAGTTLVREGPIFVEGSRLVCQNRISEISRLMEETDLSKPKVQNIADRVAGIFVPAIVAIACVVFLVWMIVGIYGQWLSASDAAIAAITYAVSALIVSCPCAIGLAVPMVVIMAQGVAVRHHLVFRAPSAIQTARKITHVVFDKTGTLTGDFRVERADFYETFEPEIRIASLLAGLIAGSDHPVDRALRQHLEEKFPNLPPVAYSTIQMESGSGIRGQSGGDVVRIGSCRWLGLPEPEERLSESAYSISAMEVNGNYCAQFSLQTAIHPEASGIVKKLKDKDIEVEILSGDSHASTNSVARQLGVMFRAPCNPEEKQRQIRQLQEDPRRVVMFVGDGTNDAPALQQADIGVNVKGGTDVAMSASDIILTESDLHGIIAAMDISKAAMYRIKFNFIWSAVYNIGAVLLAAGAFTALNRNVSIPPAYAGLGELVSVLPVILVAFSMTLLRFKVPVVV